MSTRTTLYLAVMLVVLGAVYYRVAVYTPSAEPAATPPPVPGASQVARDLLEPKPGDVVKIVCRKKGQEEWVFEKSKETGMSGASEDVWRMTSPLQMKCVKWEVDKISRRFGTLQYDVRYKPAEAGAVTAAVAGLEPPEATVAMTDAEGKTVSIQIGKPASSRETYVRLAGSDEICVGKSDLQDLFKEKALEYRDQQLWTFAPENVTRVEIEDRSAPQSPAAYSFVRDGGRWMMESPVTAKATSKVDDMLKELGRLRAIKWHDDDANKVAMYGLKPAALTVRATVEEAVKSAEDSEEGDEEDEEDEAEGEEDEGDEDEDKPRESGSEKKTTEAPPAKKVTVYEVHLSDRSPIGEDPKTYLRIGVENAVATVMKSTADKFKPVMAEWREMRITTANVEGATRIELVTREGSATLLKRGRAWSFEGDGGGAEATAVSELLKAIGGLPAVAFEDAQPGDLSSYGLDDPQAEIRLTIPGVEGMERITVGGYTDETNKLLVYVRRNDVAAVAKVRSSDVTKVLQGPHVYRDRTILDVLPSRFERISLSTENRLAGGRTDVTLERTESTWRMVEPVEAQVRQEQMDKLVEALGGLRAQQVAVEMGEPAVYGLNAPAAAVTLTYGSSVEHEPEQAAEEDAEKPAETEAPTLELSVVEHDGKYYAKRSDRPTIYEVTADLFKQLLAEYRTDRVLDFEQANVKSLLIRAGEETHVFEKRDDRWTYQPEPDLPLDGTKVENLVLQIRDLRTERYVAHAAADLARYALTEPQREVTVTLQDGATHTLWVSDQLADDGTSKGYYATVKGLSDVFLLTADSIKRIQVSLGELEKRP